MTDDMLSDIRMYSCKFRYVYYMIVRILQDEMINQDTATKQEDRLQSVISDIKSTDEEYQTEQVLNLQLASEHNTLMTELSHILNQRNSLLLECEGLRNTVSILQERLSTTTRNIQQEQKQKFILQDKIDSINSNWQMWQTTYETACNDLNDSMQQLSDLSAERDKLQIIHTEKKAAVTQLRDDIGNALKRSYDAHMISKYDMQQKQKVLEEKTELLQQKLTEHLSLVQQIDQMRRTHAEIISMGERRKAEMEASIAKKKEEEKEKEKEKAEQEESLVTLLAEATKITEDIDVATCDVKQQEVIVSAQRLTEESLQKDCTCHRDSLTTLKNTQKDITERIQHMHEQLQAIGMKVESTRNMRDQLLVVVDNLRCRLTEAEMQQCEIIARQAELQTCIDEKRNEMTRLRSVRDNTSITACTERIKEIRLQIQTSMEQEKYPPKYNVIEFFNSTDIVKEMEQTQKQKSEITTKANDVHMIREIGDRRIDDMRKAVKEMEDNIESSISATTVEKEKRRESAHKECLAEKMIYLQKLESEFDTERKEAEKECENELQEQTRDLQNEIAEMKKKII